MLFMSRIHNNSVGNPYSQIVSPPASEKIGKTRYPAKTLFASQIFSCLSKILLSFLFKLKPEFGI